MLYTFYVRELPQEKQDELRQELTDILTELGYSGSNLEKFVERAMDEKLVNVTDFIGWYNWKKHGDSGFEVSVIDV